MSSCNLTATEWTEQTPIVRSRRGKQPTNSLYANYKKTGKNTIQESITHASGGPHLKNEKVQEKIIA
jgi:hypothetical protein